MTRAKESLALTRARTRLTWGVARQMEASRFLDEINGRFGGASGVAAAFQSVASEAAVVVAAAGDGMARRVLSLLVRPFSSRERKSGFSCALVSLLPETA